MHTYLYKYTILFWKYIIISYRFFPFNYYYFHGFTHTTQRHIEENSSGRLQLILSDPQSTKWFVYWVDVKPTLTFTLTHSFICHRKAKKLTPSIPALKMEASNFLSGRILKELSCFCHGILTHPALLFLEISITGKAPKRCMAVWVFCFDFGLYFYLYIPKLPEAQIQWVHLWGYCYNLCLESCKEQPCLPLLLIFISFTPWIS